jgi:hypothetical protein
MGGPSCGDVPSAAIFSSGAADADTPYVLGLVQAAPLWFVPCPHLPGWRRQAQAVSNTYGTGLTPPPSFEAEPGAGHPGRVRAVSGARYLGHFYSAIINGFPSSDPAPSLSIPWIIMVAIGTSTARLLRHDALQVFTRPAWR